MTFRPLPLACALALLALGAATARAQQYSSVDCRSTGLRLPFTAPPTCEKSAPMGGSGTTRGMTCTYTTVLAHGSDASRRFLVAGTEGEGTVCQLYDETGTLATVPAFVKNYGRDFSPVHQLPGRVSAVLFTASGEAGGGGTGGVPCFSFQKLGPPQGGGYASRIRGYVCNRDGAPVTDAEIAQTVGAISLQ